MDLSRDRGAGDLSGDTIVAAERRKLNWSAIVAGTVATLGLQVLLLTFASAVGLSSFDPFQMTQADGSGLLTSAIILGLITLASYFFGSWVAGHWANLYDGEDAVMHGALTWALTALLMALGLSSALAYGTSTALEGAQAAAQTGADRGDNRQAAMQYGRMLTYSHLDDPSFTQFVLDRAKQYAANNPQAKEGQAVNVSNEQGKKGEQQKEASEQQQDRLAKPDDIEGDDALADFVAYNANLSEDQAEQFLTAEKEAIAQKFNESQARWQQAHRRELQQAEAARKAASTAAWTMTIMGLLALAASLAGAYTGWKQRYYDADDLEDEDLRRDTPASGTL